LCGWDAAWVPDHNGAGTTNDPLAASGARPRPRRFPIEIHVQRSAQDVFWLKETKRWGRPGARSLFRYTIGWHLKGIRRRLDGSSRVIDGVWSLVFVWGGGGA